MNCKICNKSIEIRTTSYSYKMIECVLNDSVNEHIYKLDFNEYNQVNYESFYFVIDNRYFSISINYIKKIIFAFIEGSKVEIDYNKFVKSNVLSFDEVKSIYYKYNKYLIIS